MKSIFLFLLLTTSFVFGQQYNLAKDLKNDSIAKSNAQTILINVKKQNTPEIFRQSQSEVSANLSESVRNTVNFNRVGYGLLNPSSNSVFEQPYLNKPNRILDLMMSVPVKINSK